MKELIQEMLATVHPFDPEFDCYIFAEHGDNKCRRVAGSVDGVHEPTCLWTRMKEAVK